MSEAGEGEDRDAEARAPSERPKRKSRWLLALVVAYVLSVVLAAVAMRFLVDRFFPATVLAFLPRWLMALGGVPVLLLCLVARRFRLAVVVVVALAVQPFIVGDFQVPSSACGKGHTDKTVRILTQNSLRYSLNGPWLAGIVQSQHLDLVLVQECEVRDLPGGEVDPVGEVTTPIDGFDFKVDVSNCILSRYPIKTVLVRDRHDAWDKGGSAGVALYEIAFPFGSVWVLNVHLATVRQGMGGIRQFGLGGISTMRENTELRTWESEQARAFARQAKGPLIVAGDFNLPRESQIFQSAWGDLDDAFDTCGFGFGYSKETRVKGVEFGTRIDHVLFDQRLGASTVDLAPEMGSDHRGVIAELYLR